jgi:hypothetical protein
MATSTAIKTQPMQIAFGDDPESVLANQEMKDAYDRLKTSLDARKNRSFDPSLLSAAAGFFAPTQTGGFGESLGNALGNYTKSQEAQIKQEQETAQDQFSLATMGMQLQRQRQQGQEIANALKDPNAVGGLPPVASANPAAATAAGPLSPPTPPANGPLTKAFVAPVAQPTVGTPATPADTTPATPAGAIPSFNSDEFKKFRLDYLKSNQYSGKQLGALENEVREEFKKLHAISASGIYRIDTGEFKPTPGSKYEEVPIQGMAGTYMVPSDVAMALSVAANKNNKGEYNRLVKTFVTGNPSVQERARTEEKAKGFNEAEIKTELEARAEFVKNSRDANDVITNMNNFRTFASDPDAGKMVGILANDKIVSGITLLAKTGVGTNNFSIGVPAIEDVMRNAGLNPEQQAKYRTFLMLATQMAMDKERLMKGATSDRERDLLSNAGISVGDTPQSIRMKADILTARAQFDRRLNRAYGASKMTAKDFRDSDEFDKMYDEYREGLSGIISGKTMLAPPLKSTPSVKPAANPRDLTSARKRVDDLLKQ